jgi:hypothetical protein
MELIGTEKFIQKIELISSYYQYGLTDINVLNIINGSWERFFDVLANAFIEIEKIEIRVEKFYINSEDLEKVANSDIREIYWDLYNNFTMWGSEVISSNKFPKNIIVVLGEGFVVQLNMR